MTDPILKLAHSHLIREVPYDTIPIWGKFARRALDAIDGFVTAQEAVHWAQRLQNTGFDHRTYQHPGKDCQSLYDQLTGWFDLGPLEESEFSIPSSTTHIDGRLVSDIWHYHAHTALSITDAIPDLSSALEIGGGYGAVARCMKMLHPKARYTIVDLPTSLFFAECFLRLNGIDDVEFVPVQRVNQVEGQFDIALNTWSMQEMNAGTITDYLQWLTGHTKRFYSYNYLDHLIAEFVETGWTIDSGRVCLGGIGRERHEFLEMFASHD